MAFKVGVIAQKCSPPPPPSTHMHPCIYTRTIAHMGINIHAHLLHTRQLMILVKGPGFNKSTYIAACALDSCDMDTRFQSLPSLVPMQALFSPPQESLGTRLKFALLIISISSSFCSLLQQLWSGKWHTGMHIQRILVRIRVERKLLIIWFRQICPWE